MNRAREPATAAVRFAGNRLPLLTLLLVSAALAAYLLPGLARLLIYDRSAVLDGEYWRLLSGHLVHFSPSHLTYDLAVFTVTGTWLEPGARLRYAGLLLASVAGMAACFLWLLPDMARYGGLSGLCSANLVYLALREVDRDRRTCVLWLTLLLGLALKMVWEWHAGRALFVTDGDAPLRVVPAAHATGALTALLWFGLTRRRVAPA